MSDATPPPPSRHDRLRPLEMVGGSAIAAVFVGLVVLLATRELVLSLIALGATFIIALVVLAIITMASKPGADEEAELDGDDGFGGTGPSGH